MPNAHGWARIRKVLPDAIAYAIDRSGMQCAFTTPPIYHNTGRWIPSGEGKKANLGIIDVGAECDGANTMQWAPDYDGDPDAHKKAQGYHDAQMEDAPKHAPGVRETDPKEKGPDAFGQASNDLTSADLVRQNQKALAEGAQLKGDEAVSEKSVAEESTSEPEPSTERGKLTLEIPEAVYQMGEALLALGEGLPKTRKAKIQGQLDELV